MDSVYEYWLHQVSSTTKMFKWDASADFTRTDPTFKRQLTKEQWHFPGWYKFVHFHEWKTVLNFQDFEDAWEPCYLIRLFVRVLPLHMTLWEAKCRQNPTKREKLSSSEGQGEGLYGKRNKTRTEEIQKGWWLMGGRQAHTMGSLKPEAACHTGTGSPTCTHMTMYTLMGREGPYSFTRVHFLCSTLPLHPNHSC